ncbi:MAG: rhomboid family intramembrane serine protease [Pseudomonadota bacterium]
MFLDAPVTLFLLIVNVLIGVYTSSADPSLVGRMAFRPAQVLRDREWYRFFTAGFLHVGIAHLAFNMITLFFFGPVVEGILGPARFALLYIGSDVAANALTMARHRKNPTYSAVGASGAISGVVFSYCLFDPFGLLYIFLAIPMPAILFAVLYVVFSVQASRQGGGRIAHEAHLGGAIGGLALTILLYPAALSFFVAQVLDRLG